METEEDLYYSSMDWWMEVEQANGLIPDVLNDDDAVAHHLGTQTA